MAGPGRDERAWIEGAQAGAVSDLEALFRLHWPRAYRAAYLVVHDHAGAEDIAQEAFLAAVRSLDRFDRSRPFGPWLHRIVVNRAIDGLVPASRDGKRAARPISNRRSQARRYRSAALTPSPTRARLLKVSRPCHPISVQ